MTPTIVVMIVIGIIFIFASFFVSEKVWNKEDNVNIDALAITEQYEFSERELQIIKDKIEDVIARQAKDILYETNDSLSSMANEKTLALGDYAVTVCDEIEKNHKEVMFLYSMLDDKQKEIMNTVNIVDGTKNEIKNLMNEYKSLAKDVETKQEPVNNSINNRENETPPPKNSALEQLENLKKVKNESGLGSETTEDDKDTITTDDGDVEIGEEDLSQVVSEEDLFGEIDQMDIDFENVMEEEFKDNENSNDIILEMYRNGSSILDIAKQLGLGVGEVRLVIDLYQGE